MPSYQLNVDFDSADLQTISGAGEKLVLFKKTGEGAPVAWVAIDPFNNNTIEWEENYAMYSSQVQVQHGAVIHKMSDLEAKDMVRYSFEHYGAFGTPEKDTTLNLNQYAIKNSYQNADSLAFGLAQGVQVNGTGFAYKPINAQSVPRNQKANFTPLTEVVVFLDGKAQEGMVITETFSDQTSLTFGGDIVNITVRYDSHSGSFVIANSQ